MTKKKIYLAGDMLNRGAQLQRADEAARIAALGHEFYNPQDNKEINDKVNADPEGLAERIVKHDTDAIIWSDTVILEPLPHAIGTNIELGQVKGMRDISNMILDIVHNMSYTYESDTAILDAVLDLCHKQVNRKVYVHFQDIRRQGQTETGDRRSLGIHQYMYGVALDLTNGRGIQEWEEIEEDLTRPVTFFDLEDSEFFLDSELESSSKDFFEMDDGEVTYHDSNMDGLK